MSTTPLQEAQETLARVNNLNQTLHDHQNKYQAILSTLTRELTSLSQAGITLPDPTQDSTAFQDALQAAIQANSQELTTIMERTQGLISSYEQMLNNAGDTGDVNNVGDVGNMVD